MSTIKKEKHKRHIWSYWWKVKKDNRWERLCIVCGMWQESKNRPLNGKIAF